EMARSFVDRLASHGMDITLIPGNHDVYTFESVRKRRFERYFGEYLPSEGLPTKKRLTGGTSLLLVPTVCPNLLSSRGRITAETLERVKKLLESSPESVLCAAHYPLLTRTRTYYSRPSRRLRNAEALRQVLGTSGKRILFIAGHTHRQSYEADPDFPHLWHLTAPAFFARDPHGAAQGAFNEIHAQTDGFRIRQKSCAALQKTHRLSTGDPA
ncbi:MAG: metallophosphoesterase, partial [Candidatus Hydrogenedentes bacterium]|nr:metallophosphoesterase [Candidatus Hydrogenedentota bacterium]